MDYGKSFTFVFEDKNWISKLAIGVLVTLVPIINFATYGYMIQIVKNVRDGQEEPLPEWDDFGKYFIDGLKFLAGYLVYFIPVILLSIALIPVAIVADSGGVVEDAIAVAMMCISCLIIIIAFVPLLLYPGLYIQYAKDDQISDMFDLAEIWDLFKADSANYTIILLMVFFVLGFLASFGVLLCVIGVFFTAWWAQLVAAHMIGQLARPQEKPATF